MKTILIVAGMLLSTATFATHVPEHIRQAFEKDYPEADAALWELIKEGYAATFQTEEGLKKAIYAEDGQWRETRLRILMRDIPSDVQREIRKVAGFSKSTYIGKVTTLEGRFYRIETETGDSVVVRIFDENGLLVSEEQFAFSTGKA